jgi:cytochrome P450
MTTSVEPRAREVAGDSQGTVDPAILARVGDVGRPRGVPKLTREIPHLPGKSGPLAGVATVAGMLWSGEDYLTSLARRHGPVFRHVMGLDSVVMVADPDLIWSIARNEDRVWSSALAWSHYFWGVFRSETGDGLLQLDFDAHRDARRLIQPAFSPQAVAGYVESASRIYDETVERWIQQGRVPFKAEVRRLFARVSAKVFMDIDDPSEATLLDRAMTDGWQGVFALRRRTRWGIAWPRAKRGIDALWSAIRPRVESRRNGNGTDLLSRLCRARDEASHRDGIGRRGARG